MQDVPYLGAKWADQCCMNGTIKCSQIAASKCTYTFESYTSKQRYTKFSQGQIKLGLSSALILATWFKQNFQVITFLNLNRTWGQQIQESKARRMGG